MRNDKKYSPVDQPPKRQGFYEVTLEDDTECIAEWREQDKTDGKLWWRYESDDPTAEKTAVRLDGVKVWRPALKEQIEAALKRELTRAEQIEAAVTEHMRHFTLYKDRVQCYPPANRQLQPGDAIEIGALRDCKVVETRDNGSLVIFQFHALDRVYGKVVDNGIKLRAAHWTDVCPKAGNLSVANVRDPLMYDGYRNSTLTSLFSRYLRGLDNNPDYQRGYVWTFEDKQRLLESLFAGREIGRFAFVTYDYPKLDEVLDGKQRLMCLFEYYTSQIPYKGVYWHELSPRDRDRIESRSVQWVDLPGSRYKKSDLLRIFLEVNAAGVPQTQEHLANVQALYEAELAREAQAAS